MSPRHFQFVPMRSCGRIRCSAGAAILVFAAAGARADVTISTAATSNMSCSNGICSPTASDAVLNVTNLENLLASGNVEVTTTGSGVQADGIKIKAALTWASTSTLALDAYDSISTFQPVSVTGAGGLPLTTDDGGSNGCYRLARKAA